MRRTACFDTYSDSASIDAYPEANLSQLDPSTRPFTRRQAKTVQELQGLAQGILWHDLKDDGESNKEMITVNFMKLIFPWRLTIIGDKLRMHSVLQHKLHELFTFDVHRYQILQNTLLLRIRHVPSNKMH